MPFIFSDRFDNIFLDSLYEGDIEYAKDVFASYLSDTRVDFENIRQHYSLRDLKSMRQGLHKMKPVFSFVGLTSLTNETERLIRQCDVAVGLSEIEPACVRLFDQIEDSFLAVQLELDRMKTFTE